MTPPLVTVRPDTTNDTGPRHVVVIAGILRLALTVYRRLVAPFRRAR